MSGAVAALSCVVLLAPADGFAQGTAQPAKTADAGQQLMEIVVTAQKREQKSNEVGISITALSAAQLAQRGVTELSTLTRIEPSLQYSQSTFGTPVYTIRGVGYFEESLAATQSVSLYQDWTAAKKPAELHVFAKGGHGFGMRKQNLPTDHWIERFADWLEAGGVSP